MSEEILKLEGASIYQQDNLILSNVELTLDKGEFAYLIGRTGSGKSSLLKILYGDLPLRKGSGTVCGFELAGLKPSKIPLLRRRLGIVFQDFQLLADRNVEQNLKFVLKATGWKKKQDIDARIEESLVSVGMHHKKASMPHQLSGGEQQRIAVARALLNHPELILADEPTGNLDPETSYEIMELILKVSKERNCAVLMATHDFMLIDKYPARKIKCEKQSIIDDRSEVLVPTMTSEVKEIEIHGKTFIPYILFEEIEHAIKQMAEKLYAEYKDETPLFVGVLNGVVMFMSDFLKQYRGSCELAFLQLSSYEGMESSGKVKVISDIPMDLTNRHVIILEDIVDTGNTLELLYQKIDKEQVKSLKIISLFFKPTVYKKDLKLDMVGLEIPDKFVVGYGLDYDGLGRNLPDLYQIKE
ncbi:unnamed protein product [Cyprideis torosa]|uniref:Uncharacterized protein n=1 Tax=Cyprideis torosa TaxID=163714 RepID=A0A7R8WDK7_9CRUS|nr:unnamed protein product [Cyprideis torosa]CAG0894827.1 unnamed protein product [Cyprideis torosa]